MALSVLRLRRALFPLSATLIKHRLSSPAYVLCSISNYPITQEKPSQRPYQLTPLHGFQSSAPLSDRRFDSGESKISPDEILFEGCDYNHWLITMEFPDDPKPTPEQMVETYVQTLEKVVGSREEAMKRMYACSTTTYTGFQAVMTEEMSEKFRGLPGVVFILPDSYIDPVKKEYGGDKYEMGKITPRPPPVQYGRQGRYNDRNRNYDRPRYDRPRDNVQMQGNRQFDNQGGFGQGDGRNYTPPHQGGFDQGEWRSYTPQQQGGFGQGDGRNYAPPQHNYNPMGQPGVSMQGQGSPHTPPAGYNPVGQQGYRPYDPQGSPHTPPAQGNPRSYSPQSSNDPRGNNGFPGSTASMNYGPSSGQYGGKPQNSAPPNQQQGGFMQGQESGNGYGTPPAGGYQRHNPGYGYGQQHPGSEGYAGFNNSMNPGKSQGQN